MWAPVSRVIGRCRRSLGGIEGAREMLPRSAPEPDTASKSADSPRPIPGRKRGFCRRARSMRAPVGGKPSPEEQKGPLHKGAELGENGPESVGFSRPKHDHNFTCPCRRAFRIWTKCPSRDQRTAWFEQVSSESLRTPPQSPGMPCLTHKFSWSFGLP